MLDDTRSPFLQGWAIVENTTEQDWTDVNLSLVSGRPISFIMDLYQPLYNPRPIVEPELYASLRPRVYGDVMEQAVGASEKAEGEKREDPAKDGRRRLESKKPMRAGAPAPAAGAAFADEARTMSVQEGAEPVAEGREAGSLFEYRLASPISLARQRSAEAAEEHRKFDQIERQLRLAGLKAERAEIFRRARARQLPEEHARKLVRELDLLEARYAA